MRGWPQPGSRRGRYSDVSVGRENSGETVSRKRRSGMSSRRPPRTKRYGGRCYTPKGQTTHPQNQRPKGSITLYGALSVTTNQVTWFYGKTKDSSGIIAQFLDVIEAVFSAMKRAVIHSSDYQSEEEMKNAISTHFRERNEFFKQNPKRAGKRIWEIDFFNDHNYIKSGNYREW
jgi:hypothetical protein